MSADDFVELELRCGLWSPIGVAVVAPPSALVACRRGFDFKEGWRLGLPPLPVFHGSSGHGRQAADSAPARVCRRSFPVDHLFCSSFHIAGLLRGCCLGFPTVGNLSASADLHFGGSPRARSPGVLVSVAWRSSLSAIRSAISVGCAEFFLAASIHIVYGGRRLGMVLIP
jgi:hypothetical protein